MSVEQSSSETRFIPNAPEYALCSICDAKYPAGTEHCPKCHSLLSALRNCPNCGRAVSAKHAKCIYCSHSFLLEDHPGTRPTATPVEAPKPEPTTMERMRAVLVSVGVFLIVVLVGLAMMIMKSRSSVPEFAAETYAVHSALLRLQAASTAGSAETVQPGTVLRLTRMVVDPEGRRWFAVQREKGEEFVSVNDVAPPKVRQTEAGSQMLRVWLLSFSDPDLGGEAVNSVEYFCANNPGSTRCDELRWLLAERLRAVAQRSNDPELLQKSQQILKTLAAGKSSVSSDAARELQNIEQEGRRPRSQKPARETREKLSINSGREYALVDKAEVHVKIPNLRSVVSGSTLRAPIAREIRVNDQIAVPGDATCVLQVLSADSQHSKVTLQLVALEFGGKAYTVRTSPQQVSAPGSNVVIPLDSALLVKH